MTSESMTHISIQANDERFRFNRVSSISVSRIAVPSVGPERFGAGARANRINGVQKVGEEMVD